MECAARLRHFDGARSTPCAQMLSPSPNRSYSQGLTREGGSLGKSKLGCVGSFRLAVAAAKVPGPAFAKIVPAMAWPARPRERSQSLNSPTRVEAHPATVAIDTL